MHDAILMASVAGAGGMSGFDAMHSGIADALGVALGMLVLLWVRGVD